MTGAKGAYTEKPNGQETTDRMVRWASNGSRKGRSHAEGIGGGKAKQ